MKNNNLVFKVSRIILNIISFLYSTGILFNILFEILFEIVDTRMEIKICIYLIVELTFFIIKRYIQKHK